MKKLRLLMIFTLIICCLLVLSACDDIPTLQTPAELVVEEDTLTLTWSEVKDARLYAISITAEGAEPKEVIASKTSYSLASLAEGRYTIKVKAQGKEEESKDSEWSETLTFTRDHEPGMVFTLINNKTEYEVANKGLATGDIVIPDTYRGKPVTSIGKKAFFNKSDVTGVTFGANIKTIGDYAFANCSYLTFVKLPAGLTTLGQSAFASCRLLASDVVIPDGVTVIPMNAFAYCGKLPSVTFGNQLKAIGDSAFTDCTALTGVTIPDSVTYVGNYAFALCSGLTDLDLGKGLVHIGPYAFSALPLTAITVPDSVKTIGEGAFINCEALANVALGNGVEMIDAGAFANTAIWTLGTENEVYAGRWFLGLKDTSATTLTLRTDTIGIANTALYANKKLTDITLPDSVKTIGSMAFALCRAHNIVLGGGVEIIGEQAFSSCANLANIILGSYDFNSQKLQSSSLKTIGDNAFYGCEKLESIVIPETVTVIGSYAFQKTGIAELADDGLIYADKWIVGFTDAFTGAAVIRSGTVGVSNYAFYNCSALKSLSLPSSVKIVGRAAFYNCGNLSSIVLPNTLTVIDDYTFYHCDSLKVIKLPAMLTYIGRSAFYKCGSAGAASEDAGESDFDVLVIPETVTYIGDYAFYGCGQSVASDTGDAPAIYGVDILDLGNGVKTIGDYAFYKFVSLKEVVIGDSVTSIGERAFYGCSSLAKVTFGNSLETIGSKAFYKCVALTEVELPNSLKTIESYAFYKCEALVSLDLGEGVTTVGDYAFCGCEAMTSAVLPKALTTIGVQAFRNCKSLTAVVLHKDITTVAKHAFYGCKKLTVYSDRAAAGEQWDKYWNSSYRPTVWNCTLAEDMDYVISFERGADSIVNKNASNVFSAPTRKGYTFVGWNTSSSATEAAYTMENFLEIPQGRKLFAIWSEGTPEA